ncbi:MAG: winged helix-turn-helix transcriptional regulator [Bdellovibrionales bacterium]|nr:winged helix-turn-helix transcriptional regulator [Bdellovibrionales bacterium]
MVFKTFSISKMEDKCELVAGLLRALSHPQRLMILGHLIQGKKTVTELQNLCGISQSQLSQFLGRMKLEGLLDCDRKGRFQYYSVSDKKIIKLIQSIQTIYC